MSHMIENRIKRVMVALDSSPPSQYALKAAVQLAARLDVELLGFFVEDIDLIHLASLPIAREVVYGSVTGRSMADVNIERSLRAQAARLRQAVANEASKARIHWSFQVYRGAITSKLISVGGEGDLLVLAKIVKRSKPEYPLESKLQTIISQTCCSVALLNRRESPENSAFILYDGSEVSRRGLFLAAQLVKADHNHLVVVLPMDDEIRIRELENDVKKFTDFPPERVSFVSLPDNSVEMILKLVANEDAQIMILDATNSMWNDENRRLLLANVLCPIVFLK